ncbi:PDR/VanB family oxidoreductase [Salinibacterium sp. M195]|uniref:PDR/VanB family oxidoreductase n=1 Tax=Salinibacterium sp. M195 TaxID=2583374 RepID=UPI001C632ADF|nr:PDR/VanB family oxidoreductase [Salinibacterium sp. M195]QYH35129.1 oxidoreductase [Salinibacterium sp. M195]
MSIELRVLARDTVADRVDAFTLGRPDGGTLPAWTPGSHIDLTLPGGVIRQYSLCSDPADAHTWRVAVLHEPKGRGGSVAAHKHLQVGARVHADGPRDNFGFIAASAETATAAAAPDLLFIAGGIGITPILPMVRAADAAGANWHLLYLGRSHESMGFLNELATFGDRVTVHPGHDRGRIDVANAVDSTGLDTPQIFACGPERLLDAVIACCPAELLHIERFTGNGTGAESTDTAFVVETNDGTEIAVGADETILAAMTRCGVPALNSCQEGICGTCETVVLGGVPLHRDEVLSDEERESNETMMICVSRSVGERLVLDL